MTITRFDYTYLVLIIIFALSMGLYFGSDVVVQEGLVSFDDIPGINKLTKALNTTKNSAIRKAAIKTQDTFIGGMFQ